MSLTRGVLTLTPVGGWRSTGGLGVGEGESGAELGAVVEDGVTTGVVEAATGVLDMMIVVATRVLDMLGKTSWVLGMTNEALELATRISVALGTLSKTTGVLDAVGEMKNDCTLGVGEIATGVSSRLLETASSLDMMVGVLKATSGAVSAGMPDGSTEGTTVVAITSSGVLNTSTSTLGAIVIVSGTLTKTG